MEPFTQLTAIAAPLALPNVDTDQIIPARFLRRPRDEGFGEMLFNDLRFRSPGEEDPAFVLNQAPYRAAKIIVADHNFGGGSSREHAVWALVDHGIRCVVAISFGDIFHENSVKNGLLLIRLPEERVVSLREALLASPGATVSADLERQILTGPDGIATRFEVEPGRRKRLLLGLDDIGITLRHEAEITAAEKAYRARRPWLFRHAPTRAQQG
ncbi:3-isopropylmalate dehydratase small subunit [Muricoccus radiodurans]|uniref:3-isopropylmalate dehydratase small subunit n=1 Tax=Muricoccus radiodurans TaxID=2231721 RepID=UPI003CEB70BA